MGPRLRGQEERRSLDERRTEVLTETHYQIFTEHLLCVETLSGPTAVRQMDSISVLLGLTIQERECKKQMKAQTLCVSDGVSTRVGQGLGRESAGGEGLLPYRGVREGISNNSWYFRESWRQ